MSFRKFGIIVFLWIGCVSAKCASDTSIVLNGHKVLIQFSMKPVIGTILLLQGWNFPPNDWCTHTDVCKKALEKGYNIVMPDMGKSIYHAAVFKETRADWLRYPTRRWLVDTLFVFLQKEFGLLNPSDQNFMIGLSTGARGAVLVGMDCPRLFKGIAALSGDYNQVTMTNDNLCKGYYGPYSMFKTRWRMVDNAFFRIKELKIPLYLGHGTKDKVVPCSQTVQFYKELKRQSPFLNVKISTPSENHDYQYWSSEVDSIFLFFETL